MKTKTRFRRILSLAGCAALLAGLMSLPVSAAGYRAGKSTVMVTANELEIRQGPGVDYAVVGTMSYGYVANVKGVQDGWGDVGSGWVDLDQVRVVSQSGNGAIISAGFKGYVSASQLNIRTGPGTNYPVCGTLDNGAAVSLIETQSGWGRINGGWICLDYLSPSSTGSLPTYNPSLQKPPVYNPTVNDTATAGSQVRITATQLNIRQGAGTGYTKLGTYGLNQTVELLEVKGNWGKTNRGWICLDYTTYAPTAPTNTPVQNNKNLTAGNTIRVQADSLRVRSGAGTGYSIEGAVSYGYTTKLLEVKGSWGRIDAGWISLDYVSKV